MLLFPTQKVLERMYCIAMYCIVCIQKEQRELMNKVQKPRQGGKPHPHLFRQPWRYVSRGSVLARISHHGSGGASQVAEKRFPPGIRCEALECGSLLARRRAIGTVSRGRGIMRGVGIPASKLAGRKAAASCRTPKLRTRKQAVWSKGRRNDHEGPVRAGRKPRPTRPMVRNAG